MISIEKTGSVAVLSMDDPKEKLNTLGPDLLVTFNRILDEFEKDDSLKAAVLISGKPDSFIAGADVKFFQKNRTRETIEKFTREGNLLLDRLAAFPKPIIAAVHGLCVGGGTETVLACHYRIASTHSKTKIALPEVKLGLLPGGGGTQRLPRLVGLPAALDIMLTGKNVYPHQAKKMGLVNELVPKQYLKQAAITAAEKFAESGKIPSPPKLSFLNRILTHTGFGRNFVLKKARATVMKQTMGNYPSPLKILQCAEAGLTQPTATGRETETRLFVDLMMTAESESLMNIFFAMQDLKKIPGPAKPKDIKVMGILGAGLMGSGIAEVSAEHYKVLLKDRDVASASKGYAAIWKSWDQKARKRVITKHERDVLASAVQVVSDYQDLKHADVVIEAVFEDLNIKHQVLAETEKVCSPETIFATNTSAIPIAKIAAKAARPENVIGMHYFSPVPKMPLLEIIKTPLNSDETVATVWDIGIKQGKTVIVVNDGPGFYTTRILTPYMNEALNLLTEGADMRALDKALRKFGFPVGPVVLMDEVGFDVGAHVGHTMMPVFEARGYKTKNHAEILVEAGFLGRKNNTGFFLYDGKKKTPNDKIYQHLGGRARKQMDDAVMQKRLAYLMINEAVHCLNDGILQNTRDGDIGAVFGLGFPPFTGGPFSYLDRVGKKVMHDDMNRLADQFGDRFRPAF